MAHLNSAEGIQNMCATQIMTKVVFENGFLKPGGALDQSAHLLFPKCITNFNLFPSQSHEKTGENPVPFHSRKNDSHSLPLPCCFFFFFLCR